jgi:hypothetical protein
MFLREELEAAIREGDRLRLEYERYEHECAKRSQEQRMQHKDFTGPLIYKTNENALRRPQAVAEMDPDTARRWTEWVDGRIEKQVMGLAEVVGEEEGKMHRELLDEIAKLRSELETLRTKVNGGTKS